MTEPAQPVDYLSLEDLLKLASVVIGNWQIGDMGMLASAAARPQASAFGQDAYRAVEMKAAALLHSLVRHHAMVDGNKRLGWSAAAVFLRQNGLDIDMPEDTAYDLVIAVAEGQLDVAAITDSLSRHVVAMQPPTGGRGERRR